MLMLNEQTISSLKKAATDLETAVEGMANAVCIVENAYNDNSAALYPKSEQIQEIIDEMRTLQATTDKLVIFTSARLDALADKYEAAIDAITYKSDTPDCIISSDEHQKGRTDNATKSNPSELEISQEQYESYMNHETRRIVNNSSDIHKIANHETTSDGRKKGSYSGDKFVFEEEYVPTNRFNDERKTIGEIKKNYVKNTI